jgi:hypothetical protein
LFIDKNNLKIFKTYENNLYEIVIKATQNKFENYMLSIHYSYSRRNKNKKRASRIIGCSFWLYASII